jgi:hypothetical protein
MEQPGVLCWWQCLLQENHVCYSEQRLLRKQCMRRQSWMRWYGGFTGCVCLLCIIVAAMGRELADPSHSHGCHVSAERCSADFALRCTCTAVHVFCRLF